MKAVSFLNAAPKTKLPPVVVIYGEDDFLKGEVLAAVQRAAGGGSASEQKDGGVTVSRFAGPETDLATVLDELATTSLFGERRLVVVDDADTRSSRSGAHPGDFIGRYRQALERYVEQPNRRAVLVMVTRSWPSNTRLAKRVAATGLAVECAALTAREAAPWVAARAGRVYAKKLDDNAADLLVELVGLEAGRLDRELDKLAAYVEPADRITTADVMALVGASRLGDTWRMLDAALEGRGADALGTLERLLIAGEQPIALLAAMAWQLRRMAQATELARAPGGAKKARAAIPLRTALSRAGIKPFKLQQVEQQLRRLGRPRAEQLYRWLLDTDLALKSTSGLSDRTLLETLLVRLASA